MFFQSIKIFFKSGPLHGLGLSLGLAVLGQIFLIRQGEERALVPGCLLFLLAAVFFILAQEDDVRLAVKPSSIPVSVELTLFILIVLEAGLFRLVQLDQIPAGLNVDAARIGWWALRLLRGEHFPLMKNLVTPVPCYELALWLEFFHPTRYALFLCSALLSLLTFPLIYWFFRQLAGTSTALLTAAFLAPMRWEFTLCRMAHPNAFSLLWMFGCLAFGYGALQSGRKWAWLISTLFLAGGFYASDVFKPFLVFLVTIFIFEALAGNRGMTGNWPVLKSCLLLFLVLSSPMWINFFRFGIGINQDHLSILEKIQRTHHWGLLWENPIRTALMFNHEGGAYPAYNLPGHRVLDDATGILLALGLGLGLSRLRERKYFYGWMGMVWMCLPATLTLQPNHWTRSFGALPFAAFFAASAMTSINRILSLSPRSLVYSSRWVLLGLILGWAAYQNGRIYFVELPRSPEFNWRCGLQQTVIGQAIQRDGGRSDYYLASHFQGDYTILYLDDAEAERLHPLPWPAGAWPPTPVTGRDAWFFLDLGQSGLLGLFQELYPHGALQTFQDPASGVGVYFYKVPAEDLKEGLHLALKLRAAGRGLLGKYHTAGETYSQVDPVLNFVYRTDFPVRQFPPLAIDWRGRLKISRRGSYQFILLGTDLGSLELNGQTLVKKLNEESQPIPLKVRSYPLEVHFEKKTGFPAAFHLLWKAPGADRFKVVPNDVLETVR